MVFSETGWTQCSARTFRILDEIGQPRGQEIEAAAARRSILNRTSGYGTFWEKRHL